MCGFVLGFFILFIDLFVCFCAHTTLLNTRVLKYMVKSRLYFQLCSFFLKIIWLVGVLWVCMWILELIFLFPAKNAIGILIGNALNLKITLGSMDILAILNFPVHEHQCLAIYLFYNFSQYCFVVFSLQVFHLLGYIYSKVLYSS